MSLTNPIPRGTREVTVTTAPGQTQFGPLDFLLFDNLDLAISARAPGGEFFAALAPGDFTVTPAAPAAAWPAFPVVTLAVPRPAGSTLRLRGVRIPSRATDVTRAGKLQSQSLERELDKQVATEQELRRDIDRSSANADLVESIAAHVDDVGAEVEADRIAAEAARDIAVSAAGSGLAQASSRAVVMTLVVPPEIEYVRTAGYATPGDLGGAIYKRVVAEPGHPGKFQSADGSWWEIREPIVNQYMFGAIGDGVADDTVALQDFLAYGRHFQTFTFSGVDIRAAKGTHKITGTLVMMCGGDLSAMTLLVDAATLARAMRIGGNTGYSDLIFQHVTIRTPIIINTAKIYPENFGIKGTGWAGFQWSVGLEIANIQDAHIYVSHIAGFGRNLWISAYSQGNCYNQIFLAQLGNGFYNLAIEPGNAGGWVNENTYFGGHLYHESSEGVAVVGVRDIYIEGTNDGIGGVPNNNIFIKPSIEGDTPEYQVQIRGVYNRIVQARWECHPPRVLFYAENAGETVRNVIDGGLGCEQIEFTSSITAHENTLIAPSIMKIPGSPTALMLNSTSGDTPDAAHIVGFAATWDLLALAPTEAVWTYRLYAGGFLGKHTSDGYARVAIDFYYGKIMLGSGAGAPSMGIQSFGGALGFTAHLYPVADNTYTFGDGGYRWTVIYAVSGTISTSDAREKEWRGPLNDAELRVAARLSKLIGIYRWLDAIAKKGDDARLHVGVTAQDVMAAFEAEGLDGFRYGILCYDKWDARAAELDGDGNIVVPAREAGDRYGVRYDELWAFIAAGFEARLAALEAA